MNNLFSTMSICGVAGVIAGAIAGCQSAETTSPPAAAAASAKPAPAAVPEAVTPLKAGERAPSSMVSRPDGSPVEMAALYAKKPSVLIFYRGGWCPYCNTHLAQIAKAEQELVDLGYQVLAISPDKPESLKASIDKGGFTYDLLSDSDVKLISAYGLAFRVDDATVGKYRGFGIDLDAASGRDHHVLPVPAVYIVDTKGVIRFAHSDPDYKRRLSPDELLAAARAANSK